MIDFEDGIFINCQLHKTKKNISEEINGKLIQETIEVYYLTLLDGTAKDKFISICLEELNFCFVPEYGLRGIEFVCFMPFPVGNHLRVFFSEASAIYPNFHFYIMTMDHNTKLDSMVEKIVQIQIIPRDEEERLGNV
jgi:hypothetical protein